MESIAYKPEDYGLVKVVCDEKSCTAEYSLPCWLDPTDFGDDAPDNFYCPEHAGKNGYCSSCGMFSAGIESFDLSPNDLCESCQEQLDDEAEFEDPEGYDLSYWAGDVPDFL